MKIKQIISTIIRRLARVLKLRPSSIADRNYEQQIEMIADGYEEAKRIASYIFLKNNHTTVDKVFSYLWENNIIGQALEIFYYCECDGNPALMIEYIAVDSQ